MEHLLLDRFYGVYFDTYKRLDGEVLFKIFPSNKWLNCAEFEKTLCSLLREETLGEFIASAPSTDEIDTLIASFFTPGKSTSAPSTDEIDALIAYYIY